MGAQLRSDFWSQAGARRREAGAARQVPGAAGANGKRPEAARQPIRARQKLGRDQWEPGRSPVTMGCSVLPISLLRDSWALDWCGLRVFKKIVGWAQTGLTTRIFITSLGEACLVPGLTQGSNHWQRSSEKNALLRFEMLAGIESSFICISFVLLLFLLKS